MHVLPGKEQGINRQPGRLVGLHLVRHHIGCKTLFIAVHPGRLAGRVIGHFTLVEERPASFTIPDDLLFLVVLDKQRERIDIIAIDHQAMIRAIFIPRGARTMIASP
ncbi:hypothetical protein D3C84_1115710 [compost metagenome]